MNIFPGDHVILKGFTGRDTVAIVLADHMVEDSKILMNQVVRNNLRVQIDDTICARVCQDLPNGRFVRILPFDDGIEGLTGNLWEDHLKPYFFESSRFYRPCRTGDTFR